MGELAIFESQAFGKVRAFEKDSILWFIGNDVCSCLDLTSPRSSLACLDEDEKGVHTVDTPGGPQEMVVVSEPGMYSLILRSRKKEAKAFKRWIVHEVVPAIRQQGYYQQAPKDYIEALRALADETERRIAEEERRILAEAKQKEVEAAKAASDAKVEALDETCTTLNNELGFGKTYRVVRGIKWLLKVFKSSPVMYSIVGKALVRLSETMNYPVKKVPSYQYGLVNAYHVNVIAEFLKRLYEDRDIFKDLRHRESDKNLEEIYARRSEAA